jgi:hypothetical protein
MQAVHACTRGRIGMGVGGCADNFVCAWGWGVHCEACIAPTPRGNIERTHSRLVPIFMVSRLATATSTWGRWALWRKP